MQVPAMADDDDDNKRKIVVKSDDSFVALDIAELVAATDQRDPTASPRVPVTLFPRSRSFTVLIQTIESWLPMINQKLVMKSLSRNGSQRSGGGGGGAAVSAIGESPYSFSSTLNLPLNNNNDTRTQVGPAEGISRLRRHTWPSKGKPPEAGAGERPAAGVRRSGATPEESYSSSPPCKRLLIFFFY